MITRLDVINPAKDFSFLFLFPSINTYYPNLSLSLDKVISFIQLKNISILQRLCAKIFGKIFDSSTAISMLPCRETFLSLTLYKGMAQDTVLATFHYFLQFNISQNFPSLSTLQQHTEKQFLFVLCAEITRKHLCNTCTPRKRFSFHTCKFLKNMQWAFPKGSNRTLFHPPLFAKHPLKFKCNELKEYFQKKKKILHLIKKDYIEGSDDF